MTRAWQAIAELVMRYALKFGAVGLVGYAVDLGVFNTLRVDFTGDGPFLANSFVAKTISVSFATLVTWFGNRWWTFRDRRRNNGWLELGAFAAIAVVGMGIALGCLYFSRYVLGFTSLFADNVAANIIGLGFATVFRFLMYRYWVYGDQRTGRGVTD